MFLPQVTCILSCMAYLVQNQPLEKALACHSSCEQTHFPHTVVPVLLILLYYYLTEQCGLHTTNRLREINVFLWPQRKAPVIIESPDDLGLTQLTPWIRKDPWVESSILLEMRTPGTKERQEETKTQCE